MNSSNVSPSMGHSNIPVTLQPVTSKATLYGQKITYRSPLLPPQAQTVAAFAASVFSSVTQKPINAKPLSRFTSIIKTINPSEPKIEQPDRQLRFDTEAKVRVIFNQKNGNTNQKTDFETPSNFSDRTSTQKSIIHKGYSERGASEETVKKSIDVQFENSKDEPYFPAAGFATTFKMLVDKDADEIDFDQFKGAVENHIHINASKSDYKKLWNYTQSASAFIAQQMDELIQNLPPPIPPKIEHDMESLKTTLKEKIMANNVKEEIIDKQSFGEIIRDPKKRVTHVPQSLSNSPEFTEAQWAFKINKWKDGEERVFHTMEIPEKNISYYMDMVDLLFDDPEAAKIIEQFLSSVKMEQIKNSQDDLNIPD